MTTFYKFCYHHEAPMPTHCDEVFATYIYVPKEQKLTHVDDATTTNAANTVLTCDVSPGCPVTYKNRVIDTKGAAIKIIKIPLATSRSILLLYNCFADRETVESLTWAIDDRIHGIVRKYLKPFGITVADLDVHNGVWWTTETVLDLKPDLEFRK